MKITWAKLPLAWKINLRAKLFPDAENGSLPYQLF
jgi:hypothetical protein